MIYFWWLPFESLKLFRNLSNLCESTRIARDGLVGHDFNDRFELGERARPVFVPYLYLTAQDVDEYRCEVFPALWPSTGITGLAGLKLPTDRAVVCIRPDYFDRDQIDSMNS